MGHASPTHLIAPPAAVVAELQSGQEAATRGDLPAALRAYAAAHQRCQAGTADGLADTLAQRLASLSLAVCPPAAVVAPVADIAQRAGQRWIRQVLDLPAPVVLLVLARATWFAPAAGAADPAPRAALARRLLDGLDRQHRLTGADLSTFLLAPAPDGGLADPVIDLASAPVLARGLAAYVAGDDLVALHLLVPRFEEVLRALLPRLGESVVWQRADGRSQRQSLERLLQSRPLRRALGSGLVSRIRAVFLAGGDAGPRHQLAHGRLASTACTRALSQDVLFCYLRLSRRPLPPPSLIFRTPLSRITDAVSNPAFGLLESLRQWR